MPRLHVLMFGWEYPPLHSGGLGVACQGLVRGLQHHGVQVTLVLPMDISDDEVEIRTANGRGKGQIRIARSLLQPYDSWRSYLLRIQSTGLPKDQAAHLYGPDLGAAIEHYTATGIELTKDLHPDVVHCHDWMTYEAGEYAAKHHDAPMVAHIHATELDRTDFNPDPWIAKKERRGLLAAHRVIAVSNYTKQILVQHYGIKPERIAVIHNGHNAPKAQSSHILMTRRKEKAPLVLFLGRLTIQKNPHQFLNVAKTINAHRPEVEFVMAGDGPMLGELMEKACALGLGQNMIFTGKAKQKEVDTLYRQASCFVMPSLSEPFGLVALEAVSHGVPVVLSKQSGASEVIDHSFKVDFWDTEKMADCILTILREKPLALQLSSEAPRILQKLTWKNQAQLVHSLYQNLLQA